MSIWHVLATRNFCRATNWFAGILEPAIDDSGEKRITEERLIGIKERIRSLKRSSIHHKRLQTAWEEFRETTIDPDGDYSQLRNTERPSVFFAREELGMERGIWRQIPALFVSVGLFLTFLGLVAALAQTSEVLSAPGGGTSEGLRKLLTVASAKFIMSLTGLLCSILFTLVLRWRTNATNKALHNLCAKLEEGCQYVSEQWLGHERLTQAKEQTAQLQALSTELVAQIARPLREELPKAIRESIGEAITPAMERLAQSTGKGIESLAGHVSDELAAGVRDAVTDMNEAVGQVSSQLQAVAQRLDDASSEMGGQVGAAVEALSRQISTLGTAMAASSETATQTLNDGAKALIEQMNAALQDIRAETTAGAKGLDQASDRFAETIGNAASTTQQNLLQPMNALLEQVQTLTSRVEAATDRFGQYAEALQGGIGIARSASEALGQSAQHLAAAARPVRGAADRIESATRSMTQNVKTTASTMLNSARETSRQAEAVLRETRNAIAASQTTATESLDSLHAAVKEFQRVLNNYDKIDGQLGNAFQSIEDSVRSNIEEISNFNRKLNEEFSRALRQLESVIAQAEPFKPRQET
ncbi:MAG: hypothetical protein OXE51_06270 [Gammaproteobacteria bacterium]|nr:hypothetical protein [Gammaproteobacteria bacterium]